MRKDFCLCFDDAYVPFACVTIQSIMEHMRIDDQIVIHVFSDHLSETNIQFLKKYNVELHIIESDKVFEGIDSSVWTVYTLYRLFLPFYLSENIHRVLYLDCDVIVNDPLDELFKMDFNGKAVAGVIDPQTYNKDVFVRLGYDYSERYICAGVLLMNLDSWRENNLSARVINYMKENPDKISFLEQDAINYLCCDNKIILSPLYGAQTTFFLSEEFLFEHLDLMQRLIDKPAIVHYAGYAPWIYCKNKSMHSYLWWNTYKTLKAFPQIRINYVKSFIKYGLRYILSKFRVISRYNKYHIDQYYNHPSVKKNKVQKELEMLSKHQ